MKTYPHGSLARRIAPDALADEWDAEVVAYMREQGVSRIEAEDELLGYSPTRANEDADQLAWLRRDLDDWERWGDMSKDDIEWSL